jgi:hypothetical protein
MLVLVVIARQNFDSRHFELFNFPGRWLLRPAFLSGIKPCDVIMHRVYLGRNLSRKTVDFHILILYSAISTYKLLHIQGRHEGAYAGGRWYCICRQIIRNMWGGAGQILLDEQCRHHRQSPSFCRQDVFMGGGGGGVAGGGGGGGGDGLWPMPNLTLMVVT